jgi:hypothetical protein
MGKLLDSLEEAVKNCKQKEQIDEQDAFDIMKHLERLQTELYGEYEEFAKETNMLKGKIVRPSDLLKEETSLNIAKNLLADGLSPERVAKNTGLPLRKVKALLKEPKTKQPA